jgi:LmeA-like phospholipid-binding
MNAARKQDTTAWGAPDDYPDDPGTPAITARIRAGYALTGVIMGSLWLLSGHVPIWEHLIRSAIVITLMTSVSALARRRRPGARQQPGLSFRQTMAFRFALIAVAAGAQALLGPRVGDATLIVAATLPVMAAVAGPIVHRRLVIPQNGGGGPGAPGRRGAPGPAGIRGHLRVALAVGLALTVAGTAAAELIARHVIDGRIAAGARKDLTGPVSVGIGGTPALLDAVTGRISEVTIQAPSTTMCDLQDVAAAVDLSDVHRAPGGAAAQGVSAQVTLTTQTFAALLAGHGNATVTSDPSSGQLQIDMGPGGLLQIQETAALSGDTLEFSPADITVLGRPAPQALAANITSKLTIRRQLTGLPLGLQPRSVAVTNDGLQITLTAGATTVSGAGPDSGHGCSSAA